jgi:uncharacterized protein
MRNKIIMVALSVALVVSLGIAGCAEPAGEEPVQVVMQTAAVGSAGYTIATGLEAVSMEAHPWLRIKAQESAGGGSTAAMLLTKPEWKNDIIQMATLWELYAEGGVPGYDPGEVVYDVRDRIYDLVTFSGGNLFFVTLNPNIKTLKDLGGKRVGMARIGQGHWGGVGALFFDGLYPEYGVTVDYCGGTDGAVEALLDGKVDACVMGVTAPADYSIVTKLAFLVTLEASGRDYYIVGFTDEEIGKLVGSASGMTASLMPANTIENQPEPVMTLLANWVWGTGHEFPEDLAYEFAKFYIENVDALGDYAVAAKVFGSAEKLATGLEARYVHPGALRAFEEAGVTIK